MYLNWNLHNLFKRHANGIARALRKRGVDTETAADLTQEAFLRVLVSPPSSTAETHNPEGYLYRVAKNLSIDHIRRERLLIRVALSDGDFAAIADPSPSVEATVYDRQRLQMVDAALSELPRDMQRAFILHRMGDMTLAEVGSRLGMSTTKTWTMIRDAYEHIEDRLNGL